MTDFLTYYIDNIQTLYEEVHTEIKDVLDGQYPAKNKLNLITKTVRNLISKGVDTGLEDDKPKRGSSRAVYLPKDKKPITLDGIKTSLPTAIKIAFHGVLDDDTGSDQLLGEHQNKHEADRMHLYHSIIKPDSNNNYTTNTDGVIAPILSYHPEHHWIEMPKVTDLKKSKFKELTKSKELPNGMDYDKFSKVIMNDYDMSLGKRPRYAKDSDHDKYIEHSLTSNVLHFAADTDTHPGDISSLHNWGLFTHPITGKEYPVIRDYGYSGEVAKLYHKARHSNRGVFD